MQATRIAPDWPAPSLMHRRRVVRDRITYVGLDVHKDAVVVAIAEGGIRGEVREYGRIANTATALDRLIRKLGDGGVRLRFCYEAGPCGYGIQRHVSTHGHECVVVAPSLIPRRAGDRVKTDRRDAASLAKLHRAGELTAVWVPDCRHEAMRDPGLRRGRLWYGHGSTRCTVCASRASSSPDFCCVRDATMAGRPGPGRIAPTGQARGLKARGWPGSSLNKQSITSCWKITSRPSRAPRRGAIG